MNRVVPALTALIALALVGCSPGGSGTPSASAPTQPAPTKTLTVGTSNAVDAFAIMGSSTTSGGWQSLNELHSAGLVTADRQVQAPVPRLATPVPRPGERPFQRS